MVNIIKNPSNAETSEGSPVTIVHIEGSDKIKIFYNQIDISTLLPNGYSFIGSNRAMCDHLHFQIEVDLAQSKSPQFLLDVFHEIGHINDPIDKQILIGEDLRLIRIGSRDPNLFFNTFSKLVTLREEVERNAWIYSLRTVSQLLKQGVDIRTLFKDKAHFAENLLKRYYSYKAGFIYLYEKSLIGDDVQLADMKAFINKLFVKNGEMISEVISDTWNA